MQKDDNNTTTICTNLDDLWQTTTNSLKLSVSTMKLLINNYDSELLKNAIEAINTVLAFEDDHQGILKFKSSSPSSKKPPTADPVRNNKNGTRKVLADITNGGPPSLPIWRTFSTTSSHRHRDNKENIPIPQQQQHQEIKEKLKKVTQQMYINLNKQKRIIPLDSQERQYDIVDYNAFPSPSSSSSTTNEFPNNSLSSSGTISCANSIFDDISDIIKEFPIISTNKSDNNIIESSATTTSGSCTCNLTSSTPSVESDNIIKSNASSSIIDSYNNKSTSTSCIDNSNIISNTTTFTEANTTTAAAKSRFTEITTDNIIKSDTTTSSSGNIISDNTKTKICGDKEEDIDAKNVICGNDKMLGANNITDEKQKK